MIISASRRTDLPAFYTPWFMNRVRAGYCGVPNPYNPAQVSYVSLRPDDVDVIAFWSRDPRPMFAHLDELEGRGMRSYFMVSLLNYPPPIDMGSPSLGRSLDTLETLSRRTGPDRVVWRYDPILLSDVTPPEFHLQNFERLAGALSGVTRRVIVSFYTPYAKADGRMQALAGMGARLIEPAGPRQPWFGGLLRGMAEIAQRNGMAIQSCAEKRDLAPYGILPGKCIDDEFIFKVFGLRVADRKDPGQRDACGCVLSRDIGMYDTCLFGCPYCYATTDFALARANRAEHDPASPSLLGWHEPPRPAQAANPAQMLMPLRY